MDRTKQFEAMAPVLNGLARDPAATVHYELFSGALVWSDELPLRLLAEKGLTVSCLRGMLRYRTTLILGTPEELHRPAWEDALRLFPNWPGFDPSRQGAQWRATYHELSERGIRSWEALDERYRQQQARNGGPAAAATEPRS